MLRRNDSDASAIMGRCGVVPLAQNAEVWGAFVLHIYEHNFGSLVGRMVFHRVVVCARVCSKACYHFLLEDMAP